MQKFCDISFEVTSMSSIFKTVFSFSNEEHVLIEVSRKDIESEDKSKIYFWLFLDKQDHKVTRLIFRSMHQNENDENFREFEQGSLKFTSAEAVFNGELLGAVEGNNVDVTVVSAIESYLLSL
jgi:hypothetical protein